MCQCDKELKKLSALDILVIIRKVLHKGDAYSHN